MKKYLAVLTVVFTGTLSLQNLHADPTPLRDLSNNIRYGAGEVLEHTPNFYNDFSQLQELLGKLDLNATTFTSKIENSRSLSELLFKLKQSLTGYKVAPIGFYYGPTNCSYYHYEKQESCITKHRIVNSLIEIECRVAQKISTKQSEFMHSNFSQRLNDMLLIGGVQGLITHLVKERKKIYNDTVPQIIILIKLLDEKPIDFLNSYENITRLDACMWGLISAIDVYQVDADGTQRLFSPNFELANGLINLAKDINNLIKNRQLVVALEY